MSFHASYISLGRAPISASSISFVGTSFASSNMDISVPSGAQANDIAIAYSSTATGPSPSVYSGFTQITSLNSTFEDMFQYKKLTSSDLSTTFTRTADNYDAAIMMVFRLDGPFTAVNATSIQTLSQETGTPPSFTVNPLTSTGSPNIIIGVYAAYTSVPSISGTFWDGNATETGENNNRIRMYYEIQNDNFTSRTVTAGGDFGSYNRMTGCAIYTY